MATVVDVDCHFDVVITPDEHPFRPWIEQLPSTASFVADCVAGDLLRHLPRESWPDPLDLALLPRENTSSAQQATSPGEHGPAFPVLSVEERIEWLDRIGVDHAILNPGGYAFLLPYLGSDPAAIRACNDFCADRLEGHSDRLIPVTVIKWGDADSAVSELTRMRARGSRAFWIEASPFGGRSPAHPDVDRLWSAATDLGMVAILHIGNTPARFDGGWADAGWKQSGGGGSGGIFRFANTFRNHAAEMLIGALVYGGVFVRHPSLTVVIEELGVAWLPNLLHRFAGLDLAGPWPFDQRPSELLRSHLRVSPLPGLGDGNILDDLFDQFPELFVYSSDFAHGEGNVDPINLYEPQLSELAEGARNQFLGENISDCFRRMGDPLRRG